MGPSSDNKKTLLATNDNHKRDILQNQQLILKLKVLCASYGVFLPTGSSFKIVNK